MLRSLRKRHWYRPSLWSRIVAAIFGPSELDVRVDAILERIDRLRSMGPPPRSEIPFIRHRRGLEG